MPAAAAAASSASTAARSTASPRRCRPTRSPTCAATPTSPTSSPTRSSRSARRRPARRGAWTASTSANLPLNQTYTYNADRRRRQGLHHRHRHPHDPRAVRRPRGRPASTPSTAAPRTTATATARTSPARSAARRTASPRASASSPCACSTARAAARPPASSPGIDWVTGNHAAGPPAVANMSLGGSTSSSLDQAVRNSIADGVTYALAAGNENANACNHSPARAAEALTVGSTTSTDARVVVLELRHLPGPVRARLEHHVGVAHVRHRDEHDQRHVDGDPARRRRRRAVPAGRPVGAAGHRRRARSSTPRRRARSTNPGTGSPNRLLYSLLGAPPPPPSVRRPATRAATSRRPTVGAAAATAPRAATRRPPPRTTPPPAGDGLQPASCTTPAGAGTWCRLVGPARRTDHRAPRDRGYVLRRRLSASGGGSCSRAARTAVDRHDVASATVRHASRPAGPRQSRSACAASRAARPAIGDDPRDLPIVTSHDRYSHPTRRGTNRMSSLQCARRTSDHGCCHRARRRARRARSRSPRRRPLNRPPARPIAGQYIVVAEDAADGRGRGRPRRAPCPRPRRPRPAPVPPRAQRLRRPAVRATRSPTCAPTRTSPTSRPTAVVAIERDADRRHVGPGSHRPARACRSTSTYTYDATGAGVTAYIIDTGIRTTHAQFGGRARLRLRRDRRRRRRRLQRPRHARRRHRRRLDLRRRQGRQPRRRARARLRRQRHELRRHRRHRLGDRQPRGRRAGRREHEPRRRRLAPRSTRRCATRSPTASPTPSPPATSNANACNYSPARAAERADRRRDDHRPTPARRSPTSAPAWTSSRRARASPRPGTRPTRRRTRSAARRWPRRTSPARPRSYLQGTPTALPATVNAAIVNGATPDKVTSPGHRLAEPAAVTRPRHAAPPPPPPPPPPAAAAWPRPTPAASSGTNASRQLPTSAGYVGRDSGTHRACLTGPSTADFDLALYKRSSSARGRGSRSRSGTSSTENITYSGTAGTYYCARRTPTAGAAPSCSA